MFSSFFKYHNFPNQGMTSAAFAAIDEDNFELNRQKNNYLQGMSLKRRTGVRHLIIFLIL